MTNTEKTQQTITDQKARQQAIDPNHSFIVQAPAGSGKTALLIKRYLALLAYNCSQPEQILAITFTRKAASEMRERIIEALKLAYNEADPCDPQYELIQLAQKVLAQDNYFGWQLQNCPNRLKIMTIDALCASLTKQMPVTSHFGSQPEITEDAQNYYRQAVRELFEYLGSAHTELAGALENLLLHLDNRLDTVEQLLIKMLAKRDQWLDLVNYSDEEGLKQKLEQSLQNCREETIDHCEANCPAHLKEELIQLCRFAAHNKGIEQGLEVNSTQRLGLEHWQTIAGLCLKQDNKKDWLKQVNARHGFPPPNATADQAMSHYYQDMKRRMTELLQTLAEHEGFRQALMETLSVPPAHYEREQWQLLVSLSHVLKHLCAELKVVFQRFGKVDFIEVSTRARQALADSTGPSELALQLDYRISHLLVDEFQDTSLGQYELLQLLTEGWSLQDNKTVFLVGDPMQSIYRFRQAEVGLFLRVWQQGFGQVPITPLQLQTNFRSSPQLIDWFNRAFSQLFPDKTEVSLGAVPYTPAEAGRPGEQDSSSVELAGIWQGKPEDEADYISETIKQHQSLYPDSSIAVLVRSRSHLPSIIQSLQQHGIAYQGVELETLIQRTVIQDLYALTRAMLHLADKTAWLAVLRAPWCGLALQDIYWLANIDPGSTVWHNIQTALFEHHKQLSSDSYNRLKRLHTVLNKAFEQKKRLSLRQWLALIWEALDGPACVINASDYDNVLRFFDLLDSLDTASDIQQLGELESHLQNTYISHLSNTDNALKVMTIHKAKGLQFDTVIVPALDRKPPASDTQLLRWLQKPRDNGQTDLIMAPVKAHNTDEPIYNYLAREEKKRDRLELLRLCYVAATRACNKLMLTGCLTDKKPDKNSLLEIMQPVVYSYMLANHVEHTTTRGTSERLPQYIYRLSDNYRSPYKIYTAPDWQLSHTQSAPAVVDDDYDAQQATGIVIHEYLQKITEQGISQWSTDDLEQCQTSWRQKLRRYTFADDLNQYLTLISQALFNILTDPVGQWLLREHHEAATEYALTVREGNNWQTNIIDRTFIDEQGCRWIVDYKTTMKGEDDSAQQFLSRQKCQHMEQLHRYGETMRLWDPDRVIYLGLYFPIDNLWTYWQLEDRHV